MRISTRASTALRIDQTFEEPDRGAVRESLELGDAECPLRRQLREDLRMGQASRTVEARSARASRRSQPLAVAIASAATLSSAARMATARRRSRSVGASSSGPRERRQRPAARPAHHVVLLEHRLHFVPERARLTWAALVGRGLADQVQALARARARGVEEVTVTRDVIRPRGASGHASARRDRGAHRH